MLLDRLFKFVTINDDEEVQPLNPVLAGYFSKVVQLLINRKQKQIVPYIFAEENKVVEHLLKHVSSRSVTDVILRLMHIVESNFDEELSAKITKQKQVIVNTLIDSLNSDTKDETAMNAAFVLQDIIEQKSFFHMLTKKQNLQRMYDIAFSPESDPTSESSFTTQGLVSRFVQQYNDRQKKKQENGDDRWDNSGDEDYINVNEDSDENGEDSKANNNAAILEMLISMIKPIDAILDNEAAEPVVSQFNNRRILPLGRTKLRAIELLASIVSLKHANIITAVRETKVMKKVLCLIEKHPWNNMVQLKAHQIFENTLNCDIENQEKLDFLVASEVTNCLVRMSQTPEVKFNSGKIIRNGYMGFTTQLANLIVKTKGSLEQCDTATLFNEEWESYVRSELASSNERNSRNLGGRPTSNTDEDDETNQFDVNMENIMKRFKSFSAVMQNNSSADEDDKDDDDDDDQGANEPEGEGEDGNESRPRASSEDKIIEVTLPDAPVVDSTFADASYWKVDSDVSQDELDDLLKEYE